MNFKSPSLGDAAKDPQLLAQLLQVSFDSLENELRKADPIGRCVLWPEDPAVPEGWVHADGTSYNIVKFPELAAVLQAVGPTTFTVSDLTAEEPTGFIYIQRAE